jgi:hypothetical protein
MNMLSQQVSIRPTLAPIDLHVRLDAIGALFAGFARAMADLHLPR